MGTRLSVTIETKHWNPDDLKQAIHQIDEDDSGEGKGIAPENVTAWDIIQYVAMGSISLVRLTDKVEWRDQLPDLQSALNEAGGNFELAFDGVVDSKIEYIPD